MSNTNIRIVGVTEIYEWQNGCVTTKDMIWCQMIIDMGTNWGKKLQKSVKRF